MSCTHSEPMQRILNLLGSIKRARRNRRHSGSLSLPEPTGKHGPILLQGTSIEMAAERILWNTRRFHDELHELIALTHSLPLLDSAELDGAQLAGTRAVVRELCDIEAQLGPVVDVERAASLSGRLRAVIATVKDQPPWYVPPSSRGAPCA